MGNQSTEESGEKGRSLSAVTGPRAWKLFWVTWATITAAFLLAWPLLRGIVAAADDPYHIRFQYDFPSIPSALLAAWKTDFFRPLTRLGGLLADPVTRSCRIVIPLHFLGLLAGALALDRIAVAHLRSGPVERWAVVALWLLHPATSVSAWQMDTLSQTACAAAGLWLLALAVDAWRPRNRTIAWCGVTLIGLLTKETYWGWVAAATTIGVYRGWRSGHLRDHKGEFAAAAMTLVYIALRIPNIHMGGVLAGESKYSLHIGMPVVRNTMLSISGYLTYGPLHAMRLWKPTEFPWLAAGLGAATHLCILAMATRQARRQIVALWGTALLVLSPVLVLGQISELYLFGPNALVALALVIAFSSASRHRKLASLAAIVVVAAGAVGHLSRAYHFDVTWTYARELTAQTERLTPSSPLFEPARRCAPPAILHGSYIVNPVLALGAEMTPEILQRQGRVLPSDWLARLDCSRLPERRRW